MQCATDLSSAAIATRGEQRYLLERAAMWATPSDTPADPEADVRQAMTRIAEDETPTRRQVPPLEIELQRFRIGAAAMHPNANGIVRYDERDDPRYDSPGRAARMEMLWLGKSLIRDTDEVLDRADMIDTTLLELDALPSTSDPA